MMNMKKHCSGGKLSIGAGLHIHGTVLPLILTIAVCLAIIGFGMLQLGFGSRLIVSSTISGISAREAADAGMTEAVHLLNQKLAVWPRDFTDLPFAEDVTFHPGSGDPSYGYQVAPIGSEFSDGFMITSTGRSRGETRKVCAATKLQSYWAGIGVKLNADIDSKTVFGTIPEGSDFVLSIRTNSIEEGAINLAPNTEIPGEVVVGPGGDPETVITAKKTSIIEGSVYPAYEYLDFPFKPVPDGLVPGDLPPASGGIITITGGLYEFPPITLGNGDKLYIEGDVKIYTDDMRIRNSGQLRVLSGGSLELFVGGGFIADNGSLIYNEDEDATKLRVFGTPDCTQVVIKNSGDFWGAVYAPNADLEIKNSGATYGGFVGKSIFIHNSGEFYFDARLAQSVEDPAYFRIDRWWEEVLH